MRKFTFGLLAIALLLSSCGQEKAKYVFYFIGDGMGLAQATVTEDYIAHQNGQWGSSPLHFTQFPVLGLATTYSTSNLITDSSAGGTALATGEKTYNNAIGVDANNEPLTAISYKIKEAGFKVGVTSTVTLDHATPGAFYARSTSRDNFYEIATQLPQTGFDFFGGGGFLQPTGMEEDQELVLELIEDAGYTLAYGVEEFQTLRPNAQKMVLLQAKDKNYMDALPYAIDATEDDLTQAQIVEAAIAFLENEKGFFLMSEGGRIDWACHSNDVKTAILEVLSMDQAIEVAMAFAQRHPKETLIVVTADHETGGLGMGTRGEYVMYFDSLAPQTNSFDMLHATGNKDLVKELRHRSAGGHFGWTSGCHTGIPVPVYAMGAQSTLFGGRMDNTDIPKRICQAMGVTF